ncbi:MAG: methyltransferase domain-containing protein [Saprospiraceae bacterium]|nr:methyltransferase domain-containing protein [Saprospiraceae bacterium]
MRLVQHKKEAYWFYRFLSIFYDKLVNPLFWTEDMRERSLQLARLDEGKNLKVADVGSGTGFTTEGIARVVDPGQITCVDQSPHQMARAKQKKVLSACRFILGDAENLPLETDSFDRYVSAGSIEYWPNPQKGVTEAYRILKPGGIALLIGPLEPEHGMARFLANVWMLFPPEEDYRKWFERAGFVDIETRYIRPQWYERKGEYGIAIAGRKPEAGASSLKVEDSEEEPKSLGDRLRLFGRVLVGSIAGFAFIPVALLAHLRRTLSSRGDAPDEYRESLNAYQIAALLLLLVLFAGLVWWLW